MSGGGLRGDRTSGELTASCTGRVDREWRDRVVWWWTIGAVSCLEWYLLCSGEASSRKAEHEENRSGGEGERRRGALVVVVAVEKQGWEAGRGGMKSDENRSVRATSTMARIYIYGPSSSPFKHSQKVRPPRALRHRRRWSRRSRGDVGTTRWETPVTNAHRPRPPERVGEADTKTVSTRRSTVFGGLRVSTDCSRRRRNHRELRGAFNTLFCPFQLIPYIRPKDAPHQLRCIGQVKYTRPKLVECVLWCLFLLKMKTALARVVSWICIRLGTFSFNKMQLCQCATPSRAIVIRVGIHQDNLLKREAMEMIVYLRSDGATHFLVEGCNHWSWKWFLMKSNLQYLAGKNQTSLKKPFVRSGGMIFLSRIFPKIECPLNEATSGAEIGVHNCTAFI